MHMIQLECYCLQIPSLDKGKSANIHSCESYQSVSLLLDYGDEDEDHHIGGGSKARDRSLSLFQPMHEVPTRW